jgi:2,3-dihydroxy-p-cumate/2,3-dihydroxybenzoate 3,4-dioxygenase
VFDGLPMTCPYRDLRYLRVEVNDLDAAARFASELFGLQVADRTESQAMFRSDARNYAICFSRPGDGEAVALTVAESGDLDRLAERLTTAGHTPRRLDAAAAAARQAKEVLRVAAPNGVMVEIVWRPLTSGWRYHGPRDAGIVGLQAVSLASANMAADETFWTRGLGLTVTDWAGDAVYLALDEAHHRIALYPSTRNGILGATWAVESKNNIMTNWYFLQKAQVPIAAGPGRQPASNAIFVTAHGPRGLLMSYAAETDAGPHIAARGPRQFPDLATSHCAWGSPTEQPEFLGRGTHDRA